MKVNLFVCILICDLPSLYEYINAYYVFYSFAIEATGGVWISSLSPNDPLAADDNLKILPLSKGGSDIFSSVYSDEYSL